MPCRHTGVVRQALGQRGDGVHLQLPRGFAFRLEHDASIEAYRYVGLMMKRRETTSIPLPSKRSCAIAGPPGFPAFHSLRDDLYDHLRFISKDMKEGDCSGMFDQDKVTLSSLLPEGNVTVPNRQWEEDEDLARTVMEILSGVALADGKLDASELHDLEESGVALAYRLGLNPRDIRKLAQGVAKDIDQMDKEDRPSAIGSSLDALIQKRPEGSAEGGLPPLQDMPKPTES